MENHLKKMPSPLLSLVPILVLVALLFVTIRTFGSDALSGGSQVVLLTTTAVASLLAMIFCKVKWRDIERRWRQKHIGSGHSYNYPIVDWRFIR